jgi:hypothetical protein
MAVEESGEQQEVRAVKRGTKRECQEKARRVDVRVRIGLLMYVVVISDVDLCKAKQESSRVLYISEYIVSISRSRTGTIKLKRPIGYLSMLPPATIGVRNLLSKGQVTYVDPSAPFALSESTSSSVILNVIAFAFCPSA